MAEHSPIIHGMSTKHGRHARLTGHGPACGCSSAMQPTFLAGQGYTELSSHASTPMVGCKDLQKQPLAWPCRQRRVASTARPSEAHAGRHGAQRCLSAVQQAHRRQRHRRQLPRLQSARGA